MEHPNTIAFHQIVGDKLPLMKASPLDVVLLGNEDRCFFTLPSTKVSGEHAKLVCTNEHWLLKNLDGTIGTYLNTIRLELNEEVEIQDGDLLHIGPWKFLIQIGEQPDQLDKKLVKELEIAPSEDDIESANQKSVSEQYETNPDLLLQLKSSEGAQREIGWDIFVDQYRPIILGFARNAGLSATEAEDITQTVLFNFYKIADRFEYDASKGRFRGYLKRITLNAIRYRFRKPTETLLEHGLELAEDPHDYLEAAFDREWTEHLLTEALNEAKPHFEPKTWEAFNLYGRRGLSAKQAGKRLSMSPDAIRHAKSRVMRDVREIIIRLRQEEL